MSAWRWALPLALLAACGEAPGGGDDGAEPPGASTAEARALGVVAGVRRVLGGVGSDDEVATARAVPGGFTEGAIAAEPGAYRLVQVNALGLVDTARVIEGGGATETLALQTGPTAAYRGGVLVATRGFGDDLLAADAPGLLQALRAGGGTVTRTLERLDDLDRVVTETYSCAVASAGAEALDLGLRQVEALRVDESCTSAAVAFENAYWLDGSGAVIASRQYVSPSVAYLRANRL